MSCVSKGADQTTLDFLQELRKVRAPSIHILAAPLGQLDMVYQEVGGSTYSRDRCLEEGMGG